MGELTRTGEMSPQDVQTLAEAVQRLEHPNAAAKALTATGGPTDRLFGTLAALTSGDIKAGIKQGMHQCLKFALSPRLAARRVSRFTDPATVVLCGITGGIGSVIGLPAIPIELPLTTLMAIRSIAEIARREGEDLSTKQGWLACMEVFSLAGLSQIKGDTDRYYRMRTSVGTLSEATALRLLDENVADASVLVLIRVMADVLGRSMLMMSNVTSSTAFPFVGFGAGAALNMVLMDHFQRVARSHFAIRRLERAYGAEAVRRRYRVMAAQPSQGAALAAPSGEASPAV